MNLARIRKFVVAATGALANIVALNILPQPYQGWAVIVVSVLTAALVYQVPNDRSRTPLPGE